MPIRLRRSASAAGPRRRPGSRAWLAALVTAAGLIGATAARAQPTTTAAPAVPAASVPGAGERIGGPSDAAAMARFLDRLMIAESGGRDDARNPRSTALGPFQFIESTFLEVVARHFARETEKLAPREVLALRTDRAFARRAAEAFTRDNAAALAAAGIEPTLANLRLAFLAGASGAIRVLRAPPTSLAITALGSAVVQANPFMAGMTAADLSAWSARNLASGAGRGDAVADGQQLIAVDASRAARRPQAPAAAPSINVLCNRDLASCRRWVSLAKKRAHTRQALVQRPRNAGR